MNKKESISKDIRKIISESFIKSGILKEASKDRGKVDKNAQVNPDVDTAAGEVLTQDYLGTDENEYLGFPQKVALVGGDFKDYIELFKNAFYDLKGKGMDVPKIMSILAPGIPANIIRNADDLEAALTGTKIGKSKQTDRYQPYIDPSINDAGAGNEDTPMYHEDFLNNLKSYFVKASRGEGFKKIGQMLNAKPNQLKLNPHGFWTLQFLSRLLKGKSSNIKYPEDLAFYTSNKFEVYKGRAYKILEDFYKKAFKNMFLNLTDKIGRAHV